MDPKTIDKLIKGALAVGASILAYIGGKISGRKHSSYKEKKRRKKLDEMELKMYKKTREKF